MMDLEAQLLADLDSDSDSSSEEFKQNAHEDDETMEINDLSEMGLEERLNGLLSQGKEKSVQELLTQVDLSAIKDIRIISKISTSLNLVINKIEEFLAEPLSIETVGRVEDNEEYQFLMKINDLTAVISNEIQLIHSFIKTHYRLVYPELESLIPNPIDYTKIIQIIKQDLSQVNDNNTHLKQFLSGDKILLITMSAIQQLKSGTSFIFNDDDFNKIYDACKILINLHNSREKIVHYISSRLSIFAPNITKIVGPQCASQIITSVGGLSELSKTPSCNIAAIGSKKSVNLGMGHSSIRQQGYLYESDLVRTCPLELQKQAMRIISGKLVLAARVDVSHGSPRGDMGAKWAKEIEDKLEKLGEPPENRGDKALPIPIDKPSKKRGGKRIRKFKEQFKRSELAKAQDKMVFGQKEDSVLDSFGEEIGLGMANKAGLRSITLNNNTRAKMSKGMNQRLLNANKNHSRLLETDTRDEISFINPNTKAKTETEAATNKWLKGANNVNLLKRKPELALESEKVKQSK